MRSKKNGAFGKFSFFSAISLLLVACSQTAVPVEVTRVVVQEVVVTAAPQEEAGGDLHTDSPQCCDIYRIGMAGEISTTNIWNYLGPGSIVWNGFVLEPMLSSLFTLSDQRFDFVPMLAADLPSDPVQEGDFWIIEVDMVDDALWSDGELMDANDVAFTLQTCLELQLTGNWPTHCHPEVLDHIEVLERHKLKYVFSEKPGLSQWQYGVAQAVILPEHYWFDVVADALNLVGDIDPPGVPPGYGATEEELAVYDAAASAYEEARFVLYEADASEHPSGGSYLFEKWEPGAFAQTAANPNLYFKGAEIIEYEDGTWEVDFANGRQLQLYGNGMGEETLRFIEGPYSPNVIFSVYPSADAAYLALANGDIDLVFNPLGVPIGQEQAAARGGGVSIYRNPANGFFYLGFNLRREPMSDLAFRQALELLIDKQFVAERILQNTVSPLHALVPPGNGFWHNADIRSTAEGLSRSEQFAKAKEILLQAGYIWDTEPEWDSEGEILQEGLGLRLPNGSLMPALVLDGPSAASDTSAASYSQWIEEWATDFGIPLNAELSAFSQYFPRVFAVDFDMCVGGWGLSIYPDYLVDFFHSDFDTATTGNFNTTGYSNPEFDALGDEFKAETETEQARELAGELQEYLALELPYIPLFSWQHVDIIRENVELPYIEVLGGLNDTYGFQSSAQVIIGN